MMKKYTAMAKVMGIININEDSFYAPSRARTPVMILDRIEQMVAEGADIIDFGACSTRPGSTPVEPSVEWENLELALSIFKLNFPEMVFSVDTFRSEIVRRCYDSFGSFIVNDISAGEDDEKMLETVGRLGLDYIAMHKRGTPATMQSLCEYDDVTEDVLQYFREFEVKARESGISRWILDPGFGFAKSIEQNYQMLHNLEKFKELGREILIGISRKSFIYKKLGVGPEDALEATSLLHKEAVSKGAGILRVHDVAPAVKIVKEFLQG